MRHYTRPRCPQDTFSIENVITIDHSMVFYFEIMTPVQFSKIVLGSYPMMPDTLALMTAAEVALAEEAAAAAGSSNAAAPAAPAAAGAPSPVAVEQTVAVAAIDAAVDELAAPLLQQLAGNGAAAGTAAAVGTQSAGAHSAAGSGAGAS